MNRDKLVKLASDFRTIALGVAVLFSSIAWGAKAYLDTEYMQLADAGMIPVQIKLDALNETIEDLIQEKRYEQDPKKVEKLDRTIEYKKNKVDVLIQKFKLSQ